MATDGTLRFNTKIDASGFDQGTKKLSSKVIDLKNKIQSTETEIKNLKAELEKTGDVKVKTKTAESIEKDLAKANEKVRNYSARQDEIIQETKNNLGSLYDDQSLEYLLKQNSEWVKLDKEINQTWADVEKYKRVLEQVNAAAPLAKDTAEYQNKEQKLTELSGKLEVYQAKLREAENAEKNSNTQHKRASGSLKDIKARLSSTISGLKMFANGAKKAGNVLKTAFSKTAGKAISSIRERFKKANSSTNVLEKSLRRIKNTLVRMFFFRLVHSPIDAVKEGLGEISKISPELNKNLSALKTETTYLKNSLAAMAAPIVNLLAPAFTSFFQLLANVTDKAGQLAAVLTGQSYTKAVKVQQNYAASLDESTKSADKNTKAMEKNQRALAGFDELNVLDQNDESDAEESSSASTPMFENVGNAISGLSGRLVGAIRNQDFGTVGQMIGEKINSALERINWNKIKTTVKKWAGNIADLLNGFIASTDWALVGETISNGIQTAFLAALTFLQKFDFSALGKALGTVINQLASPETAKLIAKTLSSLISGIFSTLISLIKTIDWGKVSDSIISLISNFDFSKISGLAIKLLNSIATALKKTDFKQIGSAFRNGLNKIDWKNIWNGATRLFTNALQGLTDFFGLKGVTTSKLKKSLQDIYKPASDLYSTLKNTLSKLVQPLINDFLPSCVKFAGAILKGVNPIISAVTPIFKKAIEISSKFVNSFAPALETAGETIGKIVDIVNPILLPMIDLISGVSQLLAPAVDGILRGVKDIADFFSPVTQFVGGIADGVGKIFNMLTGNGDEATISAKVQEEIENLAEVSGNLDTISGDIRNAIDNVNERLGDTTGSLDYIDTLKSRMKELLQQSTLSPEEMSELKTVADLLAEKLPGFDETWKELTSIDAEGNLQFKKNREEVVQAIDDVIEKLKQQYATEALEDAYKDLYNKRIEKAKEYSKALDELQATQEEFDSLQLDYDINKLSMEDSLKRYNELYGKNGEQAEFFRQEYQKYKERFEISKKNLDTYSESLKAAEEKALKAGGAQEELDTKLESLNNTMKVVSGQFDAGKDNLQTLRDAINEGFVDISTVEEQYGILGKTLYSGTKNAAERGNEGYQKGVEDSKKLLENSGLKIAETVIDKAREGLDEHSPSRVFRKIGSYTVEGMENGITERMPALMKLIQSLCTSMTSAVQSGAQRIGEAFNVINPTFKSALNIAIADFNIFLQNITSGINQSFSQINALNKAFSTSAGRSQNYAIRSTLAVPIVPKLAQGTFIPANYGEFLAVLGDNKREAEVVSPISAMKQALLEAMAERRSNDDGEQVINLYIGEEKFFTWIVGMNNRFAKQHGYSALSGGVDL